MKFKMAENSIFATLLRSPWWVSMSIAAALALLALSFLPVAYRVVGAVSGFPFVVIGALAARRQWDQPSQAQVVRILDAVSEMKWPALAKLLEEAFQRDGYTVEQGTQASVDFELIRQGKTMLVSARRCKSARTGIDALRPLQAARLASDASHALYIGLGELTDSARAFAIEHRITIWQGAELAQALRHIPLKSRSW